MTNKVNDVVLGLRVMRDFHRHVYRILERQGRRDRLFRNFRHNVAQHASQGKVFLGGRGSNDTGVVY